MKILFTEPKDAVEVSLVAVDETKVVENERGQMAVRLGVGKPDEMTRRKLLLLARKAVKTAKEHKLSVVALSFKDFQFSSTKDISDRELGRLLAENFFLAEYDFTRYKSPPKGGFPALKTLFVTNATAEAKKGFAEGEIVAIETNHCRDLSNTPGGDMTPSILADAAKHQLKGVGVLVTVLDLVDIKKLKMGLILGVAKGSAEEPKFIIAEYWGAGKASKEGPIVLVGKGVTFDTGGINLKPTNALLGMNQDMSGGAAVIAAVAAAARLKLKKNVIALVPAVENAVSGSAYRPGDILTAMNGKTVEVLNTDAEGRLILGDALTYAERYNPRLVVDVATLTGAAIVAVGKRFSAIMTRNQKLEDMLRELGDKSGDYVWPLPLWKEFEADLKGVHADIANVQGGGSPAKTGGGAIQGGTFLAFFTTKFPLWAHIDIAPRSEALPEDNLVKGAVGAPVRLLVRLIENA